MNEFRPTCLSGATADEIDFYRVLRNTGTTWNTASPNRRSRVRDVLMLAARNPDEFRDAFNAAYRPDDDLFDTIDRILHKAAAAAQEWDEHDEADAA